MSTYVVWTYLLSTAISLALPMWVARTLHKNGRVVLGVMHFFNVFNFAKIRRKAKERRMHDELLANRIGAKLDPA